MMRIFGKGLAALFMCSALVVSGCGAEAGNSGTTGTADAGSDSGAAKDTAGGGGGSDATSDATDTKDTAVVVDPCDKCKENQDCVTEGATKVCKDKVIPCKDGCKTDEICDKAADGGKGKCIKPACNVPDVATFKANTNINKISALKLLTDKEGCDLNDDASPDNVLGKIVGLYAAINDTLTKAVKEGSIVIMLAPNGFKADGTKFTCDLLLGAIDEAVKKDCDATKQGDCKYLVDKASYNQLSAVAGICPALVTFDPTTVKDGKLKAGGDKQNFDLTLPVVGIDLKLRISRAQISADVTDATGWKTSKGMLCGVIAEEDLSAAIDAVPDEVLAETGFDKATIKSLIAGVLKPDIDTDGDNTPDAISVALSLETFMAEITGYKAAQ